MSEALIWYRKRGSFVDPEDLKPQTITNNTTYEAPVTGTYWIGCVGGGGGGGGGCWNAANSSTATTQFYGNNGTRGTLSTGIISLNAGDKISCTLGAAGSAGTNNATRYKYSNGCNNSMGTNGGTGGTTTFGSHLSGAGGRYGNKAWSWQVWTNTFTWNNVIKWENKNVTVYNHVWTPRSNGNPERCYGTIRYNNGGTPVTTGWFCDKCSIAMMYANDPYYQTGDKDRVYLIPFNEQSHVNLGWSNTKVWTNRKTSYTSNAYTSSRTGSWWYTNTNNQIADSGTRSYRGDGGNSGRVGNAGFIVIKPPQV